MSRLKTKILLITIILKYQKICRKENFGMGHPFGQMGLATWPNHPQMKIK
jgi:hypothetical protein